LEKGGEGGFSEDVFSIMDSLVAINITERTCKHSSEICKFSFDNWSKIG